MQINWLGQVPYQAAWDLQKEMVQRHHEDRETADEVLLLEHPPTYTLGVSGSLDHLLIDDEQLKAESISVHHVNRGGDITYHGPGQLVGYPILNLRRLFRARGFANLKLHGYVRDLEEVIIQTIAHFGLAGWRYAGYTGVWVGPETHPRKIAAIGIHVTTKGISSHGFALNVNPNMTHFRHIVPCGISDYGVTCLSHETNQDLSIDDVLPQVKGVLKDIFSINRIKEWDYQ